MNLIIKKSYSSLDLFHLISNMENLKSLLPDEIEDFQSSENTCTFKIIHELSELNEKKLSDIDNRDDGKVEIIDVTSSQVTGTGTKFITINPTNDFESTTEYYLQIDASAFDDTSGNSYVGISDTSSLSFTSADIVAPIITGPSGISGERIIRVPAQTEPSRRNIWNIWNAKLQK